MKLVFLGTPAFAVPSLERTVAAGHHVIAVFTQPDRPKGRGQKNAMPPVKEAGLRLGLPVHQPERVRKPEVVEELRAMAPEAMVVVGYGQIIPQAILDILHVASSTSTHRCCRSIAAQRRCSGPSRAARSRTGVTTMRINAGLDTGDMLLKRETEIGEEETAVELGERLAVAGAELLERTLEGLRYIQPEPQDDAQAIVRADLEEGRRSRGLDPAAARNSESDSRVHAVAGLLRILARRTRLHVWKAREADVDLAPGALQAEQRRLFAGCGDGSIEFLEVQLEGKKRMDAAAFLNGFAIKTGEVLA